MSQMQEIIQTSSWVLATVGGLVAALRAVQEMGASRRLRAEDLRWRKAILAKEMLEKQSANRLWRDAARMLDYSGRTYEVCAGDFRVVAFEDLGPALRPWRTGTSFTPTEVFIRDCFDEFLDGLELLEHYLRTGLVEFVDIEFPMGYHVAKMRQHWGAVGRFAAEYNYVLALAFAERFPRDVSSTTGSSN